MEHNWYEVGGYVPYDLNEPSTVTLQCSHCSDTKVVNGNFNEATTAITNLCKIRNMLREKTDDGGTRWRRK